MVIVHALTRRRQSHRYRTALRRWSSLVLISATLTACSAVTPIQPDQPVAQTSPAAAASIQPSVAASPSASARAAVPAQSSTAAVAQPLTGDQPLAVTGTFTYSNDIITTYYVEHAVALVDMYGFVTRDQRWEIPVDSQILGYLDMDEQQQEGAYEIQLPARPQGTPVDVDNDGQQDAGVQVFAVSYWPNLVDSPYSVGDDRSRGWPSYLASTVNDAENQDEVIGGNLVVWAPDDAQQFPTGFGQDGSLFTEDDPIGPIPAGYSVVNLDQEPFTISRDAEPSLTLNEPKDAVIKDFSTLSYTDAFRQMFERIRKEYAFNGESDKEPNWDQLYAELMPRVTEAQDKQDPRAFYLALRDFTMAFKDGHVGLDGGQYSAQDFQEQASGGYGFAVRELDDGRFIVVHVTENGPADEAGMVVGAEIVTVNDKPINEAASAVETLSGPFSTDFALRYQQQRYLTRAPVGTQSSFTFANPDEAAKTVTLTAVEESESFQATSLYRNSDPNALPVEYTVANGIGYVKLNSNYDDLGLIVRLFERALQTFEQNQVTGIILDLRQNSGGAPLGLAGFLTDQEIPLGQLQYYSDSSGQFENEGLPERVEPNERQYDFDRKVLLVDQSCFSACEIEAYGFSQVPGMVVLGQYPTAGVEAEVARGQYRLPEGLSLQVPTGRFVLPDGSIFLEGEGVEPTQRVPINQENVLSGDDVVLREAIRIVTGQ